jgi:hypothetical protein
MMIEGMGHDLPPALWPRLTGAIADHASHAAGSVDKHPAKPSLTAR